MRDKNGRWLPGTSPNPSGRPPVNEAIRGLLEPHRAELIQKAVNLALGGDMAALKLCIDRLVPPLKAEAQTIPIELDCAARASEKADSILSTMIAGEIPLESGIRLLDALAVTMKIREIDDLETRIKNLEARLQQK